TDLVGTLAPARLGPGGAHAPVLFDLEREGRRGRGLARELWGHDQARGAGLTLPCGVHGGDAVLVGGVTREARVACARAAGGGDGAPGAPGHAVEAGAALQGVAGNGGVRAGWGAPGDVDVARADRGGGRGWRGGYVGGG